MRYSLLLYAPPSHTSVRAPRIRWWAPACGLFLGLLASCGSPKPPSADDFRQALQAYFDAHLVCLPIAFTLPADMRAADSEGRRPLDALVAAGLAVSQGSRRQEIGAFSGAARTAEMRHYELTDAGRKVLRPGRDRFLGGSDLCFAATQVVAIESFTPSAQEALSERLAHVTYRYRLKGVAPWTDRADLRTAIPGVARMLLSGSGTATGSLVLGAQGWALQASSPPP